MIVISNVQLSIQELLEQYEPLLRSIANKIGKRDNEDVMQEMRIAVWEAVNNFNPEYGHLGAYMKKKAWGRAMNFVKKEQLYHLRHPNPIVKDNEGNTQSLLDYIPSPQPEFVEEEETVQLLMDKLTVIERKLMIDFYFLGYGMKEIATKNNECIETLRSRKKRALKKLKQHCTLIDHSN